MIHSEDATRSFPTMGFATGEDLEPLELIRASEGVDWFAIALEIVTPPDYIRCTRCGERSVVLERCPSCGNHREAA